VCYVTPVVIETKRVPAGAAVLRGDITEAIQDALIQELAEVGYGRLSIEAVARRAGWPVKSQGGAGRPVFCCHSTVAEKLWVYPPPEGSRWTRPLEFAYGLGYCG